MINIFGISFTFAEHVEHVLHMWIVLHTFAILLAYSFEPIYHSMHLHYPLCRRQNSEFNCPPQGYFSLFCSCFRSPVKLSRNIERFIFLGEEQKYISGTLCRHKMGFRSSKYWYVYQTVCREEITAYFKTLVLVLVNNHMVCRFPMESPSSIHPFIHDPQNSVMLRTRPGFSYRLSVFRLPLLLQTYLASRQVRLLVMLREV